MLIPPWKTKADAIQVADGFPDVARRIRELEDLMFTSQPSSQVRDSIESDVLGLHTALNRFATLRNACSPLLRIPPEVLAQIVDVLIDAWPAQSATYTKGMGVVGLGWITLSHACRQLRDVLLGRRELWAQHAYRLPRARDCMLERAGNVPISFRLTHAVISPDDVDFIIRHLPSARAVEINERVWMPVVNYALEPAALSQRSFPFLEELVLRLVDREQQMAILTRDVWELPPPITPLLKTLRLECMAIPFNPTTLTTLSIAFDDRPSQLFSTQSFLDILQQCTLLQELELTFVSPHYPLIPGDGCQPIELPALERLRFDDDINVCLGLWNHISVPSSCTALFHLNEVHDDYTESCSHLQIIQSHFGRSISGAPIVGLSVWDAPGWQLGEATVSWHISDPGRDNPSWTGPFQCDFRERLSLYFYSIDMAEPHLARMLEEAIEVVNAAQIQVLEIGSTHAYNTSRWTEVLTPFINVHTLYLERMPRTSLLFSLMLTEVERQKSTSPILPRLRFLWLGALDLNESGEGAASPGPDRVQFVRILSSRKRDGRPIEHLRLGELRMDATMAENSLLPRIRAIVPLVECDGIISASLGSN